MTATRGTTNGNARGSSKDRVARRAWLMTTYAADVAGLARCYRCGCLLYNPDTPPGGLVGLIRGPLSAHDVLNLQPLTVDRIKPGCLGGTYRRDNIRPACGPCNSETGGATRGKARP